MTDRKEKGRYAETHQPRSKNIALASYGRLPTVGQYCRSIGLSLRHHAEWKKADCPFCGITDGFLIRPDCGAFKCRECGARGNGIVALHMDLHSVSYGEARAQLAAMVRGTA